MNIRRMVIGDYKEVSALWLSCKGMGLNDLDDSRDGIGRFFGSGGSCVPQFAPGGYGEDRHMTRMDVPPGVRI